VAIAAYYFTYLGAIGVFLPFISLYLKDLGLPASEVTQLMALGPLASLLVPPVVGFLADFGRARVWLLRLGTAATAVVSLGFIGVHGRVVLVATMMAFSAFRAPLLSLVDASALDRGHYGRIRLWGSAGFLVAVLAGGYLHDRAGALRVMAGCSGALAVATMVSFALPAPPLETRPRIFDEWRKMLAQRRLWLFLVAVWLTQSAGAIYDSGFSLHLQRLGFDGRFVARAWAVGVGTEVLLMWASPALLRRARAERLLAAGAFTGAIRWFLLGRAGGGAAILLLQPLHAVTFGLTYIAGVHVMRDRGGATPTAAQGLYSMVMMVGSIAGMTAAGWLLERLGGQGMFTVASAVALLGAGCAFACADLS
jgi:MFS transporter, PPP family, 3-phenylpropionic acid transporter